MLVILALKMVSFRDISPNMAYLMCRLRRSSHQNYDLDRLQHRDGNVGHDSCATYDPGEKKSNIVNLDAFFIVAYTTIYPIVCVHIAINIEYWDNDPIVVSGQVDDGRVIRREQFIQKVRGSRNGDPFASMNRRLEEYRGVSLNSSIFEIISISSIRWHMRFTFLCDNFKARIVRP